jgi:GDPmannose 4,6-dehydratase
MELSTEELNKVWLISGVTGQTASYYCDMLLEKGYTNIHGIMRRSATFNTQNIDHIFDKLQLHYGDLTDAMNIHNIIAKVKPDYIVNFAAQSHVAVSAELENYTIQVNTIGVLNILQSVRNLGLSDTCRIYQCGTSEEFGNFTDGTNKLNEDSPKIPVSIYAVSKLAAEQICDIYKNAFNMFIVTGTLMNHESPRRGGTFLTKKVTNYVSKYNKIVKHIGTGCGSPSGKLANKSRKAEALNNIGPLQLGALDSKRDWSHAKCMCDGIYLMLMQKTPKNYLLSNDTTHSVKEFVELAFKEIGILIEWVGSGINEIGINALSGDTLVQVNPRYFRPIDVKVLIGDSSRARKELGWSPKYSFEDLVKEMVQSSLV